MPKFTGEIGVCLSTGAQTRPDVCRARDFLSSIAVGDAGSGGVIAETASQGLNAFIGKKE
jgi:hypothetical protein